MLEYVTYKYVRLRDSRLGALYYLLAILILVYSLIEIFLRKGYMQVKSRRPSPYYVLSWNYTASQLKQFDTNPQGTVKLILSDDFADEASLPASSDLPYCRGNISCRYLDPWDLNWPIESRAVTITTFSKDRVQDQVSETNSAADEFVTRQETQYFTQSPERVVVKVDHAVVAGLFTDERGRELLAASQRQITGQLVDSAGNTLRQVSVPGKPDKLVIGELLNASGVHSLDLESDSVTSRGRTYRKRGCILRVSIFYQNWFNTWFGTTDIQYVYRVKKVPFIDNSLKQVIALPAEGGVSRRMVRKMYAVRVEFEQTGSLGMFSLSALVIRLASGIGLLTLTATLTDTLALYVLPNRRSYRKSVYEEGVKTEGHHKTS